MDDISNRFFEKLLAFPKSIISFYKGKNQNKKLFDKYKVDDEKVSSLSKLDKKEMI